MPVRSALIIWIICSIAGATIVALPDDGPRLISFSEAHGPSLLDSAGIVVLLLGWAVLVIALVGRRARIKTRLAAGPQPLLLPFFTGLGAGLIIASVASDFTGWWIAGAIVLITVQLWLVRAAL